MRKIFCLIMILLTLIVVALLPASLMSCAKKEETQQIVDKAVQDVTGVTTIRQGQQMIDKLNKAVEMGNSKLQGVTEGEE